eukprot:3646918-Alexandrium_andersonii.AAC.1
MSASLVGSEMCIRDSFMPDPNGALLAASRPSGAGQQWRLAWCDRRSRRPRPLAHAGGSGSAS